MPPQPPSCRRVCSGKKKNIMYEQCRDAEGKIVTMRRIGDCETKTAKVDVSGDIDIQTTEEPVDDGDVRDCDDGQT